MKIFKIFLAVSLTALLVPGCSSDGSTTDLSGLFLQPQKEDNNSSQNNNNSSSVKPDDSLFTFSGNKDYVSPKNVSPSDAVNQSTGLDSTWWKKTSFYHVWVKSFYDSDGDGCGDIKGVEQKLAYIQDEVGCDGIWLSPIFECSYKTKTGNMHGYDTTDYYAVNDFFGTEADVISLLNAAHNRGMKVIFDYVPNHTSDSNNWFIDSAAEKNGKKDWFMWNTTQLNWDNSMGSGHWYNIKVNGSNKYYYGAFGSGMPDFNFRNYEVREEMKNVARYWLNKGFDGIRVDAARYLIEDNGKYYDTDGSHEWFKDLRKELDKYASPKFMMCEVWGPSHAVEESYLGNGTDEFHMTLDFHQGTDCITSVGLQQNNFAKTMLPNKSETTGFATFMVNHDEYNNRIATTFVGDQKLQKLATALSLLRPTVPVIYYGTEVGLKNTASSGDVRFRGDFNWNLQAEQSTTENSLLKLNYALNSIRKKYASEFADATVSHLSSSADYRAAYIIEGKKTGKKLLVVYNLSWDAKAKLIFNDCPSFTSASCIAGDKDAPALSLDNGKLTVANVAPSTFRIYALDADEENIWDDETFIENETYTPDISGGSTELKNYTTMYIRGSFNSWGGNPMTLMPDGKTFTYIDWFYTQNNDAEFNIAFKFCENDGMPWGDNWGENGGEENIIFKVKARTWYIFEFNPYTKTYKITEGSKA